MTKRSARIISWLLGALTLAFLLAGCGGGGSGSVSSTGSTSTGKVTVSLTDAPTTDVDHVWVTVKEIRFHLDPLCDDLNDGAWLRYPLAAPVTLDLAALNNGKWDTLWDGIILPAGNYQQIRLILESTAATPPTSWQLATGLTYYNQVTDDGKPYPLIIPAAQNGIKLIGSFRVTAATPLHIVVDFDVTHDVVETGNGKYILKPRLKYFVVSDPVQLPTAAIVGTLLRPNGSPFANYTGYFPMIKAEVPETITFADGRTTNVMGIKRATVVKPDGTFILYPLPAPAGQTYDLVIGGKGLQTMILQDVPAVSGTTGTSPSMFTIKLQLASDYPVGAKVVDATNPDDPVFGATVGFYQTLPGPGEIPYLIRFRHVNPLTGSFGDFPVVNPLTGILDSLSLAKGLVQVGTFNPKALGPQSFIEFVPLEGPSSYAAYATAPFFWPGGPEIFSPTATIFATFMLQPNETIIPPDCDLDDDGDKGYYVVNGGLVVDHVTKAALEAGQFDFTSIATNGQSTAHDKGKPVSLGNNKPVKIKVKNKKQ